MVADNEAGAPSSQPAEERGTAQERPGNLSVLSMPLPWRLIGFGLVFTWDWCITGESTMHVLDRTQATGTLVPTALVVVQVIALVAFALFSHRIGAPSYHRWFAASGVGASLLGTLALLAYVNMLAPSPACALAAGGLLGYANATLMLSWAEVFGRIEPGRVFLFGACGIALAGCLYILICQLAPIAQAAATIAVPLVSFALCHLSILNVGRENIAGREKTRYSFPWKPVLIMGTCGFTAAFVDVALFEQGAEPHYLADIVIGGVLLAAIVVLHDTVKPVVLVGVGLGCLAAGILCVAFGGAGAAFPASFATMASYVIVTFFTYALLANISYRHEISSMWLFGFAMAARTGMDHVGGFSSGVFPQLPKLADSPIDLALMSIFGLVTMGAVLAVWLSERSFNSTWAVEVLHVQLGRPEASEHELLLDACEAATDRFKLTSRESEVLELLLEGCSYQEVCSRLLLSMNTVKSHVHHAYAKLGVHTRDEALAAVLNPAADA